jgi:hypothetical protein
MEKARSYSIDEPSADTFRAQPQILLQRDNEDALKEDLLKTIGNQKRQPTRDEVTADHQSDVEAEKEIPQYQTHKSVSFQRVSFDGTAPADREIPDICALIQRARQLRKKWLHSVWQQPQKNWGGTHQESFDLGMMTPAAVRAGSSSYGSPTSCKSPSKRRRPEIAYTVGNFGDSDSSSVPHSGHTFKMNNGIVVVRKGTADQSGPATAKRSRVDGTNSVPSNEGDICFGAEYGVALSIVEFYKDLSELQSIVNNGPVKSFSFRQLEQLKARFKLHCQLNGQLELAEQKSVPHRDFYNVRKVDTHVHHSACMHQKHLLRFIKSKLKKSPDDEVLLDRKTGRVLKLIEVFQQLKLTAYDLNLDTLDMHATDTFHRFDRFNLKYNPCGQPELREIFLKTVLDILANTICSPHHSNTICSPHHSNTICSPHHSNTICSPHHSNTICSPHDSNTLFSHCTGQSYLRALFGGANERGGGGHGRTEIQSCGVENLDLRTQEGGVGETGTLVA